MSRILAINPGSTSTKIAVFEGGKELFATTLRHSAEQIGRYPSIIDQFSFRRQVIVEALQSAAVDIGSLDAVVGRGGLTRPVVSGVYEVGDAMIDELTNRPTGQHASNLGALLARDIARMAGVKAYIADPVVVDELQDVARLTGLPELERVSIFHALNQKAMARCYADSVGRRYEELNLVVVHLGGGISVGAHRRGEVVDVNNALNGDGPFSPERAGGLPSLALADLCFSGRYSRDEVAKMINGRGGVVAHLGTNNMIEVEDRVSGGDVQSKLVLDAMCYNVAKLIGSMAVVLCGEVDAVILTGGIAYSHYVCSYIERMVRFVAPVVVMAGENELEALADNAQRVLDGRIEARQYA